MTLAPILPLLVALVATLSAGAMQRRLRPAVATWALTLVTVVAGAAVFLGLGSVVLGVAAEIPWLADRVGWCHHWHRQYLPVPIAFGPLAAAWLVVVAVRMVGAHVRYRRLVRQAAIGPAVEIVETDDPIAYSVPGRPGRTVLSSGLLRSLRPDERRVVLAHERSHVVHHHGRFVHLAEIFSLTFPPLRLLAAQVRFATERWADEDAALVVGDRRLVARALARAALAGGAGLPRGALALTGLGVPARVEALLREPAHVRFANLAAVLLVASSTLVLTGSTVQLHHLVELADHLCRVG